MCTWASLCIPMYVFCRTGNKFSGITYLLLNQLLTYTAKETNTYTYVSQKMQLTSEALLSQINMVFI